MTSFRARWCLGILVAGYGAMAAVAGAPNSPLTVLLPTGAGPPSWSTDLAGTVDLDRVGRSGLIGVSWTLVVLVFGAFVLFGGWYLLSARKWFKGPKVQGSPEEMAAIERDLEAV